jgi:hypothetical protein
MPDKFNPEVIRERRVQLAMSSPDHLKLWLRESGRTWIVLNGPELVDALPWPGGVQELMDLVFLVAQHRSKKPSGRMSTLQDPVTGEDVEVPINKGETLEPEELDRAIRFLVAEIRESLPHWALEDAPL